VAPAALPVEGATRAPVIAEIIGLDLTQHQETAYTLLE
jgi:hypothetical protein